jgi:hypothetical protein
VALFSAKKFCHIATAKLKQLFIENLLRTRGKRAKKMKQIGQELDFWEVSLVLLNKRAFQEGDGHSPLMSLLVFKFLDNL